MFGILESKGKVSKEFVLEIRERRADSEGFEISSSKEEERIIILESEVGIELGIEFEIESKLEGSSNLNLEEEEE